MNQDLLCVLIIALFIRQTKQGMETNNSANVLFFFSFRLSMKLKNRAKKKKKMQSTITIPETTFHFRRYKPTQTSYQRSFLGGLSVIFTLHPTYFCLKMRKQKVYSRSALCFNYCCFINTNNIANVSFFHFSINEIKNRAKKFF